jgi:hypothetical protein
MSDTPTIPPRVILANVALILLWLPIFFIGRLLITRVVAGNPSADLLVAARMAVIGTLVIVTASYLFGVVLIDKYLTQNLGRGSQRRVVRPMLLVAITLYAIAGVIAFA